MLRIGVLGLRTASAGRLRSPLWESRSNSCSRCKNVARSKLSYTRRMPRTSQIFQAHAAAAPHIFAFLLDPPQKAWIVFQPIFEPVVLRLEPDQYAGWLAMPGNDDVALCSFTQQMRQVVLDLGKWNLPHAGFPNRASHVAASV